jgi:multidrug transporter EmrE-like cation transporter
MRAPITALLGVLLFHESLSIIDWLLISVLFFAELFIHADEKFKLKSFFSKATVVVFVWIFTSVWFNTAIKFASLNNGYWEVSFWSNLLTMIFLLPTLPLFAKDVIKNAVKK